MCPQALRGLYHFVAGRTVVPRLMEFSDPLLKWVFLFLSRVVDFFRYALSFVLSLLFYRLMQRGNR